MTFGWSVCILSSALDCARKAADLFGAADDDIDPVEACWLWVRTGFGVEGTGGLQMLKPGVDWLPLISCWLRDRKSFFAGGGGG